MRARLTRNKNQSLGREVVRSMARLARISILSIVFSVVLTAFFQSAEAQQYGNNKLAPLVKQLSPSVVNISTTSVSKGRNFSYE